MQDGIPEGNESMGLLDAGKKKCNYLGIKKAAIDGGSS